MVTLCETCGKTVSPDRKRCDACWHVEALLPDYLKNPKGQMFARKHMPLLDDWNNNTPDAWDYNKVLADNDVKVAWGDKMTVDGVTFEPCSPDLCGWCMSWKPGVMDIGPTSEVIARKAAALFVSLWLRGVSTSFADKLIDGFIMFLELQENTSLTFLAEVYQDPKNKPYLRLTREGFCTRQSLQYEAERKIIETLDPQPDEEIIVTVTKRKKL